MNLQLHEILKIKTCQIVYKGQVELLEQPVTKFSTDSRTIQSDEIFVALTGEKFDGHQFIPALHASGIKFFIVTTSWYRAQDSKNLTANYFLVQDTLQALQEISRYYRLKFPIPLLALTGSNGKTTTKEMIASVLEVKYQVLKNKGNLNNQIGVPLSLFEITPAHDVAIIEMGTNHIGEIARLAEIAHPNAGLITNIGPAHLEFFGSLEGVFKAKRELWQFLEQYGEIAFINMDDKLLGTNLPSVKKIMTYGFESKAQVQGKFLGLDESGKPGFRVDGIEFRLGIVGMHNISNALAAVAVGLEFDVAREQIKLALERFVPASKRMEIIQEKGLVIINDCYNSNPESAKMALLTLSQLQTKGKRIAVLGDMLELGNWSEIEHKKIGEFVASIGNIHYLLTFGPLSQLTAEQAAQTGMNKTIHFENKSDLIDYLKRIITESDLLLIKGSRGMQMEEVTKGLIEQ